MAFQEDIFRFSEAFLKASKFSIWRSNRNKFLFFYTSEGRQTNQSYNENLLFKEQPDILVVESEFYNSSEFVLKTNQFIGSFDQYPQDMYELNRYNAKEDSFMWPLNGCVNKLDNLEGREVILGAFNYRPFMVLDYVSI